MGSEDSDGQEGRRRRDADRARSEDESSRRRYREGTRDSDSRRERDRRRDKDRDRERSRDRGRDRDRDEESKRRRSRSRSPEHKRRRHGHRERDRDREDTERRRESSVDRRSRRHRGGKSGNEEDDERSDAAYRERRRRRSPDGEESPRKHRRKRGDRSEEREAPAAVAAPVRRGGPLPSQADSFAVTKTGGEAEADKPKEKPNFGTTGVLAAASNSVEQADGTAIALKYHEPPEARKPPARDQWRLFVFKGADVVDTVELASRSCWLVGREAAVVDLLAEHPSVSKQHAALQFRHVERRDEFGARVGRVRPYLIDLESANGTKLNGERVPPSRFLELRDRDVLQFGLSSREYVVMLPPRD